MSVEVDAIVARLASAPLNASDSKPTSPTYPYVVVYAGSGVLSADREADDERLRTIDFQTTTVGVSAGQCRAALDRVLGALEGWTPMVAGRTCTRMVHEDDQPVRDDDSLPDRVVYIATDQWSFVSEPA